MDAVEAATHIEESNSAEDQYEDLDDSNFSERLAEASQLLKSSAVLFGYISDPTLIGRLSARERKIIQKHVSKLTELAETIDADLSSEWE